eukprot:308835_1
MLHQESNNVKCPLCRQCKLCTIKTSTSGHPLQLNHGHVNAPYGNDPQPGYAVNDTAFCSKLCRRLDLNNGCIGAHMYCLGNLITDCVCDPHLCCVSELCIPEQIGHVILAPYTATCFAVASSCWCAFT